MLVEAAALFGRVDRAAVRIPSVVLLLVAGYLAWRLWAFTLRPWLHPRQPRELPYAIPWLGHAVEWVSNGVELLQKGRLHFDNTREPFVLMLGGTRVYVLTAAEDVAQAYRDTVSFALDEPVAMVTEQFGVSKETVQMFWTPPKSADEDPALKAGVKNPQLKCMAHVNNDNIKAQLLPGAQYDGLAGKIDTAIHELATLARLQGDMVVAESEDGAKVVSWRQWSYQAILQVAARAMFGDALLAVYPTLLDDFDVFDAENWRLWYKMPKSEHVFRAKDNAVEGFAKWLRLPAEDRSDACTLMRYYQRILAAKDVPQQDVAHVLTLLFFVANTNTWKGAFWTMAYLQHHPDILQAVRDEIKPAHDIQTGRVDLQYLLKQCPLLNAVFDETLRLAGANSSMRLTSQPVTVHGKHIPAGAQVLCPLRELHSNPAPWGADVAVWNPYRFLKDPKLKASSHYRPFGGGHTLCPGRFMARTETLLFTALVLCRFDMELVPDQAFPRFDFAPNPALMSPGGDLLVRVKPRRS